MNVVERRLTWLEAVLETDDEKLRTLIQTAREVDDTASAAVGSRDMTPLHRSGPCAGFESLQVVHALQDVGAKFRSCKDAAAVKSVQAEALGVRRQLTCLQAACKASNTELTSARTRALAAAEARAKKEAKKKNLQPDPKLESKKKAMKTAVQKHVAFTSEPAGGRFHVVTASAWNEAWRLDTPFVLSSFLHGQDVLSREVPGLKEELTEFGKLFNESSFKVGGVHQLCSGTCTLGNLMQEVTEGRAARACPNSGASSAFRKCLMDAMPESIRGQCVTEMHASSSSLDVGSLSKACNGQEQTALATQTYGLAAGHSDLAVTELGWMSCVRWTLSGTRSLVLVSLVAVQKHVQAKVPKMVSLSECVEWGRKVSAAEWADFLVAAGRKVFNLWVPKSVPKACAEEWAVQFCTIGPYDLLWVPVGWMYFHDVMQAEDVLGVRQVILTRSAVDMHKKVVVQRKLLMKLPVLFVKFDSFENKSETITCCSLHEVATDSVAIKFREWHDAALNWFAEQEHLVPVVSAACEEKEAEQSRTREKEKAELCAAREKEEAES
eukprot:6083754-Amphidinium_carterae.3